MVKITGEITSSGPCVGGIIGSIRSSDTSNDIKASAVTVAYCSNYGPVTINKSGAGGIVGSVAASRGVATTIDHCFNGSSVLAGYTETSATSNNYYAGGIVGNINENTGEENTVKVSNCYNAGIIKAGHKANTSMSYAAGIVAHAKDTNDEGTDTEYAAISNCYNEGSIEALGTDPTTGYQKHEGDGENKEKISVSLVQTSSKNVSAYYIADIPVTNCNSIGLTETDSPTQGNETYLRRNGSALEQGSVDTTTKQYSALDTDSIYYTLDYKTETDTYYEALNTDSATQQNKDIDWDYFSTNYQNKVHCGPNDDGYYHLSESAGSLWGGGYKDYTQEDVRLLYYGVNGKSCYVVSFEFSNIDDEFIALQYGTNNIPIVFASYQTFDVSLYRWTFSPLDEVPNDSTLGWFDHAGGYATHFPAWEKKEVWKLEDVADLFIYPAPSIVLGWGGLKADAHTNEEDLFKNIYKSGDLIAPNSANSTTISLTKSSFVSEAVHYDDKNNVTIGGQNYIVIDGYNEDVFSSGTHSATFTVTMEGAGLDTAKNYYTIDSISLSATDTTPTTTPTPTITSKYITGVRPRDDGGQGVNVEIKIYADSGLTGYTASATVGYSKTTNVALKADSAFLYTDENSFAIDVNKIVLSSQPEAGQESKPVSSDSLIQMVEGNTTLEVTTGTGENATTTEYDKVVKLTDGNGTAYYFVYSPESSRLTYYFNAKLKTGAEGEGEGTEVNDASGTPLSVVDAFPTSFTVTKTTSQAEQNIQFADAQSLQLDSIVTTTQTIGAGAETDIQVNMGRCTYEIEQTETEDGPYDVISFFLDGKKIGSAEGLAVGDETMDEARATFRLDKNIERFYMYAATGMFSIYHKEDGTSGFDYIDNGALITQTEDENGQSVYKSNLFMVSIEFLLLIAEADKSSKAGFYALTSDYGIKSTGDYTLTYTPPEEKTLTVEDTTSVSGVTIVKTYKSITSTISLKEDPITNSDFDSVLEADEYLFGLHKDENSNVVHPTFNLQYKLERVGIINQSGKAMAVEYNGALNALPNGSSYTTPVEPEEGEEHVTIKVHNQDGYSAESGADAPEPIGAPTIINGATVDIYYGANYNPDGVDGDVDNIGDYYHLSLQFTSNNNNFAIDWDASNLDSYAYTDDGDYDVTAGLNKDSIKNSIVVVSQGGAHYLFVIKDTFGEKMTAKITPPDIGENFSLAVTYNEVSASYDAFDGTRTDTTINTSVYNKTLENGKLAKVSTPFQNASNFASSFTDTLNSGSVTSEAFTDATNRVKANAGIILTGDAFVKKYVTLPKINANGYALVVAHDDATSKSLFQGLTTETTTTQATRDATTTLSLTNAYIAGTAIGGGISETDADISKLNNIKLFGTIIKGGETTTSEGSTSDADFMKFTGTSTTITNYMALMNNGTTSRNVSLSSQTLKGLVIAANGVTNVAGGGINISSATADGVILKAGDGANGRYSGYDYKEYASGKGYVPHYDADNKLTFDRRNDNRTGGQVTDGSNTNSVKINGLEGLQGGEVCTYTSEQGRLLSRRLDSYANQSSEKYGDQTIDEVRVAIEIPRGYTHVSVKLGESSVEAWSKTWYNVVGKKANDHTVGSGYTGSTIWYGKKRGTNDSDEFTEQSLFMLKQLFMTIAYKDDDFDGGGTETDANTSEAVKKEDAQVYPKPTAAVENA